MAGYTRQSVADIINGADITAPPINAEFNQLASAFNASTGHSHDGTTGNAPKINLATSLSGYLPAVHGGTGGKNNFSATTNPAITDDAGDGYAPGSLWENTTTGRMFICVGNTANAAVWRELVQVETNNVIKPITNNSIDLGTPAVRFQDLYLSGGISASGNVAVGGTLNVTGATTLTAAVTANGGLTVNGATTLAGNVTIGDALSSLDTIAVAAGFTSNLVPDSNAGVSLGTSTKQWNNLYLDGTATIDTLTVDENATIAGTLGVTGASTLGNVTVANITVTENSTHTFANSTISNLGSVTTAAIGGGTINNTVIGGSTAAAITGTTITASTGFSGDLTGDVTGDLTGSVSGNVTASAPDPNIPGDTSVSTFYDVTINNGLDMTSGIIDNVATPTANDHAATKGYVDTQITNLIGGAPDALDTLNELAAAINDDENVYTTLTTSIGTKLPKAGGTMTGVIAMGNNKITGLATPTLDADAATKKYVDDQTTLAQTYASNASASATNAAASYDSFDDRYLGAKASDPTLDNDGDALLTGALYYDSTNSVMKVYSGSEWNNASSSISGIKSNFYYTATSGQTAFSGTDDNSNSLVIDKSELINVYMNGVRLHEDDYTISVGTNTVTLATGAATGDLIYLEVFGNFAGQSGAEVAITGGSITGLTELGIGEASPDRPLHISASVPAIKLEDTDVAGLYHEIVPTAAGQLQFKVDAGNVQANSKFVTVIDGAERLKVDTSGIDVIGNATFGDNGKAIFGAGSDLQIYHDGSNSVIRDAGTGNLKLQAGNFDVTNGDGTQDIIKGVVGGAVRIYHSNAEKIATTSTGINVTGTVTADRYDSDEDLPTARPSLVMDFANSKTLDPRVTFYRNSTATYWDGKTKTKAEENLLRNSQAFTASTWVGGNHTLTDNAATAPDGTTTACSVVPNTTNIAKSIYTPNITVSGDNTQSLYVKANGYTKIGLRESETGAYYAAFDVASGGSVITTSNCTATITDVGNSWYRITMTGNRSGVTRWSVYFLSPSYTSGSVTAAWAGDGTSGYYIWGAQIEDRWQPQHTPQQLLSPIIKYQPVLQTAWPIRI